MKFISEKKHAHIYSQVRGEVVGRFMNGEFETNEKDLIAELKEKYNFVEKEAVAATVSGPSATNEDKGAKTPKESNSKDENKFDIPEDLDDVDYKELIVLAKDIAEKTGEVIFTFGMKKAELVEKLESLR